MISKINLVPAKTILTKSGLPGSDWVINPYNGCQFACMYCYAAQIARWKHQNEEWGTFLDVKINAPELLKIELEKLEKKFKTKNFGSIFFSSVTDPYTSLEAKYDLTRKCLEILSDFKYTGEVCIQTKSNLILKDLDILKKIKNLKVGFTVTTLDDKASRFLEIMAPSVSDRLAALKKIHNEGIKTYAFIGPILPHFIKTEKEVNKLLDQLEIAGVGEVWFEHINLNPKIKERLFRYLSKESSELVPEFFQADSSEYRQKLETTINNCLKNRKFKIGLNKIIYHKNLPKKKQ